MTAMAPLAVGLAEGAEHLRVAPGEDDAKVLQVLRAAQEMVETATGVQLTRRTLVALAYEWPAAGFALHAWPIYNASVTYTATDSSRVSLAGSALRMRDQLGPVLLQPATHWPHNRAPDTEIRVEVDCGFPEGACPEPLRAALLMIAGNLYRFREDMVMAQVAEIPMAAHAIMAPYRRSWIA